MKARENLWRLNTLILVRDLYESDLERLDEDVRRGGDDLENKIRDWKRCRAAVLAADTAIEHLWLFASIRGDWN